jgi:hypothetical protein
MQIKRLLQCAILEDDQASERFAIFLGFTPISEMTYIYPAAVSRYGRREIARRMDEAYERVPLGAGYVKVMEYRGIEAG